MPKDGFKNKPETIEKSVSPPNKFSAKLSKPVAVPPPRKSQNPYLMELISSGAKTNEDSKDKKVSPAKKILSAFNGKKSPTNARSSPGANRRGSPGATGANKRGSPGANKRGSPTANKRGSPGANQQKKEIK